jgi:hypothetical protein
VDGRRLTGMTRITGMLLSVALAASVAGCARPAGGSPAGPARSPSASTVDSRCAARAVVDETANGATVCVALGSSLTVMLHPGGSAHWSTPQVAGRALGPGAGMPTPAGAVGWSFPAIAAGTAQVTVARPNCPSVPPGSGSCYALLVFQLRVDVR